MGFDGHSGRYRIRNTKRRDIRDVLAIDEDVFEFAWKRDDLIRTLKQDTVVSGVVEDIENDDFGVPIVGYMVCDIGGYQVNVFSLAVARNYWGKGIGTAMVEKLKEETSCMERRIISIVVRERDLPALNFFKNRGFWASRLLRDYNDFDELIEKYGMPEDGIQMEYSCDNSSGFFMHKNRISGHYSRRNKKRE